MVVCTWRIAPASHGTKANQPWHRASRTRCLVHAIPAPTMTSEPIIRRRIGRYHRPVVSAVVSRQVAAESFVIEGGHPLGGRVRASGNKNGGLPILAACLLTDEQVTLTNVPRIEDVESMIGLLHGVGAEAEWTGPNELRVHAADITSYEADN